MSATARKSLWVFFSLATVCVFFNCVYFPHNIICWDVFGYYLYLPLGFQSHDLALHHPEAVQQIIDHYGNTSTFYQAYQLPSGKWVLKYSMGMAVLYCPFYFLGHLGAMISGYPTDGFSLPYQVSLWLGGICYTIAGLWILRKILLRFFSDGVTAVTLTVIYLGTNYFFHSSFDGQSAMSHNYLFTLYAAILYLTIKWHESYQKKHLALLAFFCGLAILSRPTEIVCLLIPAFWGVYNRSSLEIKVRLLLQHKIQILLFAAIVGFILSWQVIYWKFATGKFLVNSYGGNPGEGLDLFNPHIAEVLLSFRKGWLIYTPVMIFAIIGFVYLYRRNRGLFLPLFAYFVVNFYLVACWSNWWYAESFGQRALIPSYAVLAIPMGYFIQRMVSMRQNSRIVVSGLLVFVIVFNLFQTYQFKRGVIHPSRMTAAYYFSVFGKSKPSDQELLLVDHSANAVFDSTRYAVTNTIFHDFESDTNSIIMGDSAHSGQKAIQLDSSQIYSPAIELSYRQLTRKDHVWIKASVWVFPVVEASVNPASFSVAFNHKGKGYRFKTIDMEKIPLQLNQWNKLEMYYITPDVRNQDDLLKVYVWLRGSKPLFVDDMKIEILEKID